MKLEQLFDTIASRLKVAATNEPETDEACLQFGREAMELYNSTDPLAEIERERFFLDWLPWLLGKGVITTSELKEVPAERLKTINIYNDPSDVHVLSEGRNIVLSGECHAVGAVEVFAYGDSKIKGRDCPRVTLFDHATMFGSGLVFMFNNSTLTLSAKGVAYCYDNSRVKLRGEVMAVLFDNAEGSTASSESHLINRREAHNTDIRTDQQGDQHR